MQVGDYIQSKELRAISLIEIDLFSVGKSSKPDTLFQIKTIELDPECAHGGFVGSVGWKGKEELLKKYEVVNYKNKKNIMSTIKSLIKSITRGEPEKSFVKAGFLDDNDSVTTAGREALEYVLWNANKDELKKLADQINEASATK